MSEFLNFIKNVLKGQSIDPAALAMALLALFIYKIIGKYIEEIYFRIFPFKNQKSTIASLRQELLKEIAIRQEAQRLGNAAIEQSHAYLSEVLAKDRVIVELRKEIEALKKDRAA